MKAAAFVRSLFAQWLWRPVEARQYDAVRIVFAVVALLNIADLWPHRFSFFAEGGMIDREVTRQYVAGRPYFSVFLLANSPAVVSGTFMAAALACVCLGLGIWARVAAAAVFAWHLSYTYFAFSAMHAWDALLRCYSFILLISPLGGCWVVSRRWFSPGPVALVTAAAAGTGPPVYGLNLMRLQLLVVYLNTVWVKVDDPYWRNGEFFAYFMMSMYARVPSLAFARWEVLSGVITYGTLLVELAVPLLLWVRRTRWLGFALGLLLHGGIAVVSVLHLFSLTMLVGYAAFLRGPDVERIEAVVGRLWRAVRRGRMKDEG